MIVNKDLLLKVLKDASVGVSPNEYDAMGLCVIFIDNKIITKNNHLEYYKVFNHDLNIAVRHDKLKNFLSLTKFNEVELKQEDNKLCVYGNSFSRKILASFESVPLSKFEQIKVELSDERKCPQNFVESLKILTPSISRTDANNLTSCFHIRNNSILATNTYLISKVNVDLENIGEFSINSICTQALISNGNPDTIAVSFDGKAILFKWNENEVTIVSPLWIVDPKSKDKAFSIIDEAFKNTTGTLVKFTEDFISSISETVFFAENPTLGESKIECAKGGSVTITTDSKIGSCISQFNSDMTSTFTIIAPLAMVMLNISICKEVILDKERNLLLFNKDNFFSILPVTIGE